MPESTGGDGDKPIDWLGVKHRCIFDEEILEVPPLESEIQDREMRYIKANTGMNSVLKYLVECLLIKESKNRTRVELKIGEEIGHTLPPEAITMLLSKLRESAGNFKSFCDKSTS